MNFMDRIIIGAYMVISGFSFLGISKGWDLIETLEHYKFLVILAYTILMIWWQITAWLLHRYNLERLASSKGPLKDGVENIIKKKIKENSLITKEETKKEETKTETEDKKKEHHKIIIEKIIYDGHPDKIGLHAGFSKMIDDVEKEKNGDLIDDKESKKIERQIMLNEIKKHVEKEGAISPD